MKFYILNDDKSVSEASAEEFYNSAEKNKQVLVHKDKDFRVSTVFLTFDHSWNNNSPKPELFETMVFDENDKDTPIHQYMERTDTYENAVKQHYKVIGILILYKLKLLKENG